MNNVKPFTGGPRRINQAGIDLIKKFEGLRLKSYLCPAGVWTVGWGSAGPDVGPSTVLPNEAAAHILLMRDLVRFERAVQRAVTVPLTDNQFAALVSFTFNLGEGALQKSTLLKLLNAGDYNSVPSELQKWVKAGGQTLAGLVKRRMAEADLWRTQDADTSTSKQ